MPDRPGARRRSAGCRDRFDPTRVPRVIAILRARFDAAEPLAVGPPREAADRRLAPAPRLMRGDPGRQWQLEELVKSSAMSRTTFALYFKTIAGVATMAYHRMTHEARRASAPRGQPARRRRRKVARYTTESAFSNAFKRVTGLPPMRFRSAAATVARRGQARSASQSSDLGEPTADSL